MSKLGKRAEWSSFYKSDRPRDVLGLTQAQEALTQQFIGFSGHDQQGEPATFSIIVHKGSTIDLATYATVPVGTLVITPLVAGSFAYQRITKVAGANTDWNKIAKTSV